MRYLLLLFIVFYSQIYFENDQSNWKYIFDGKSFDGWHQYNSDKIGSQWSIDSGELIFTNNNEKNRYNFNPYIVKLILVINLII